MKAYDIDESKRRPVREVCPVSWEGHRGTVLGQGEGLPGRGGPSPRTAGRGSGSSGRLVTRGTAYTYTVPSLSRNSRNRSATQATYKLLSSSVPVRRERCNGALSELVRTAIPATL